MFKKTTTKLWVLFFLTGLFPLVLYGGFAIYKSRHTARQTVLAANQQIVSAVSERIYQYLHNAESILESVSENMNNTNLSLEQKQQVLINMSVDFDMFHLIQMTDLKGTILASSNFENDSFMLKDHPALKNIKLDQQGVSDVFLNENFIPAIVMVQPLKSLNQIQGSLIAEIDLMDLWKLVNKLKIGQTGFLNLITPEGRIFASGAGFGKSQAIEMQSYDGFSALMNHSEGYIEAERDKKKYLIVASVLPKPYHWVVTAEQPLAEALILSRDLTSNLIWTVLILSFLIALLGYNLSQREIIRPFQAIMRRMSEITQGKLDGEVYLKGESEFAVLARTINQMSQSLIAYQKKIIAEERKAVVGQIAAHLAHDLKHPVQNITNYIRMLFRNPLDTEYQKLFFKTTESELKKMNTFLETFNDLSREMPFVPVASSVHLIIDQVLEAVHPELVQRNIQIKKRYDDQVKIKLDLMRFERLLSNILRNAIDVLPQGGQIAVDVTTEMNHSLYMGGAAKICIQDSGPGIPKENLEGIFSDFKTTKKSGIGLGLAICKKIVSQHQGEIWVESELGQGTTFCMRFPLVAEG